MNHKIYIQTKVHSWYSEGIKPGITLAEDISRDDDDDINSEELNTCLPIWRKKIWIVSSLRVPFSATKEKLLNLDLKGILLKILI